MSATLLPPLFFGPVTPYPSWQWVGADVASALSKYFSVGYFEALDEVPDGAVVFWVKNPGGADIAEQVQQRTLTLLFFPVDCFLNEHHIREHASFIDAARLICLHTSSLAPFFKRSNVAYVDHYRKYGVTPQQRMPEDFFLWVGGYQYAPYVIRELLHMERPLGKVVLLTNRKCEAARDAALENATKIGFRDFDRWCHQGDTTTIEWTESAQRNAMLTCKAAFDVKYMGCFNQFHKPPTKIQKYICSQIPCAVNRGVAYLDSLYYDVPALEELFGVAYDGAYLKKLAALAERLSQELSLCRVSQRYIQLASQALLATPVPCIEAEHQGDQILSVAP
ncbi:hypothetical protein J2X16_004863 [Pelomonas aquatica]|uniref:Glycosyltransferase family 1 protein n=1 Tax=Pelomonas aquatica TaxID=431058 RepID=A0ABU1ZFU0_9BURK|nr:hypothetical protein [Pelomonas aquatica]MDR7299493.1 hypothetical protein [Pelomonas aquatica]